MPGRVADAHAEALGARILLLKGSARFGTAQVLVRPEAVQVEPAHDGQARVVTASFLGATGRVPVRTHDGLELIAQVDNAAVERFAPGSRVRLTLRPDPAVAVAA